jgi:hypothetical protein
MPNYYVQLEGMSAAEVEAPDRRHARTVYLDYLARKHLIPYGARQEYRRLLELERVEPGMEWVAVRLQLSYTNPDGISSAPMEEEEVTSAPVENIPVEEPLYTDDGMGQFVDDGPLEEEGGAESPPSFSPLPKQKPTAGNPMGGGSPIMNLSRTSGGS